MAARMNPHRSYGDTNPYAAPEIADRSMNAVNLPPGSPWKIDGDALLCCGDLTFDWLCFATGIPLDPDNKVFYMKVFAPSQQHRILFRVFHSLSIAAILMLLILGRIMQTGSVKISGVPSFVFFLAYVGIFIIILRRTPSFQIYYRLSPEGHRRRMIRRTIPSLAAGMVLLGPIVIFLPRLFVVSFGWGMVVLCTAIAAFAGFMMLLPEPRAVSLHDGIYRLTYLDPELLAALKCYSPEGEDISLCPDCRCE